MKKKFHWGPRPGDKRKIRKHLRRQRGLPPDWLKLDNGVIVVVGYLSQGEK